MPKLLDRFEVAEELKNLIEEALVYLILISPYFKLNDSIKKSLLRLEKKKNFGLIIVYGKNEEDKRKSLSDEDINFFKSFPDVEIRYHKRLHAKIYLNEKKCLITSLNLHDYSLKENIEVGILTKSNPLDRLVDFANSISKTFLPDSLDSQAAEFAKDIVEKSTIEFKKEVKKEKHLFGLITTSKGSVVTVETPRIGFCIRTKSKIPFNIKHPYSPNAYQSWQQYGNKNYKEKYCHQCGKSHQTTMSRPLCFECYKA